MGHLRFPEIQTRPAEGLDLISLTVDAFQQLFPPFEAAFQTHMAEWRFDGQPRTDRGSPTDQNWLLPAPEDRLLWILVYLKTYPLQVVQGGLFGMGLSKAQRWIRYWASLH
jgi:Helix-turn-helix of DDE superfamily endonuclease